MFKIAFSYPAVTFLLIVPYGIEMSAAQCWYYRSHKLLIVPYGIEIRHLRSTSRCHGLLIVPYGIEINLSLCG